MLQRTWIEKQIKTPEEANAVAKAFHQLKPEVGAFDTETTGLHIIADKPFIVQTGFLHPSEEIGYAFAMDLERNPEVAYKFTKYWFEKLAPKLKLNLAHNTLFDLNMLENIGISYRTENLSDTEFYIRYAHDAVHVKEGGPPLKLKPYAAQYVDTSARFHEKLLDSEKAQIAKEYNVQLRKALNKRCKPPKGYKSYTAKYIDEIFSDALNDYTALPEDAQKVYLEWLQTIPLPMRYNINGTVSGQHVTYNLLNRENVIKYALKDIVWVLEAWLRLDPVLKYRKNEKAVKIENDLLIPTLEMERQGFSVDKEYLLKSKEKVKAYIIQQRKAFTDLAGCEVKIGQHELIKQIFEKNFGLKLPSTNAEVLKQTKAKLIRNKENPKAVQFIELLEELRTLEKWYSTYIIRFIKELQRAPKLYTQIDQVGAVTGRVTSNFQQFPKSAIMTKSGEELFHPRKIIVPSGGHKIALAMADFSQIELRVQALYTMLVGHADLNLCRAYMPYQCIDKNGHEFDPYNPEDIANWKGEWYLKENPTVHWEPTDVHGATTTEATGLKPGDPGFKEARSKIGKRVDFAKNYGAQLNRIRQMFPDKTESEIRRINDAYYKAFPGVKFYHEYCYERASTYSYTSNLFGVRYYNVSGHNLINMLIQGSAATMLKIKEREIYDFIKKNNLHTRWLLPIHDELVWELDDRDDPAVIFEFKKIMETWPDFPIPIVAEVDCAKDCWANKKGCDDVDALRLYLSS